jgi:hypothetical protein
MSSNSSENLFDKLTREEDILIGKIEKATANCQTDPKALNQAEAKRYPFGQAHAAL